jgi:YHS domain-containing protein
MPRYRSAALLFAVLACTAFAAPPALAQSQKLRSTPEAKIEKASKPAKPVNAMCPIGEEPIVSDVPTAMYKGQAIGFCCPSCNAEFMAWDEAAKDKFVALAVAHAEPGQAHAAAQPKDSPVAEGGERIGDPYPLTTCPVSGEALGGMGDAIVSVYGGREVRFCCAMCVPRFEADPQAYFEKIDQQIIASQLPYYPLETCVVTDEALLPVCADDPSQKQIDVVVNNRLVRLCCKGCLKELRADPERSFERIDSAIIALQRENYPLDTCLMSGEPLVEGEVVEVVLANRLFRLCCNRCKRGLKKDPTETIAGLDKAWADKGGLPR